MMFNKYVVKQVLADDQKQMEENNMRMRNIIVQYDEISCRIKKKNWDMILTNRNSYDIICMCSGERSSRGTASVL